MQRRHFLLAAASSIALPSFAQSPSKSPQEAYKQISPPVPGEAKNVRAVVAFDCPVCARYHGMITGWGNSLPKQFLFNFIPVVTDKDSAVMAMAWLAMEKVSPQKLPLLASSLFSSVQEKGITASTPVGAMWKKINMDVGPTPGFREAFQSVKFTELEEIQRKITALKIEVTPSIVIAGRYLITPDNVNGDEQMFMQLASGMVSKMM